jgi:hypothetical protein
VTARIGDLNGNLTTLWLSGGTVGATYSAVNEITATQGRTDDRTHTFRVRDL